MTQSEMFSNDKLGIAISTDFDKRYFLIMGALSTKIKYNKSIL